MTLTALALISEWQMERKLKGLKPGDVIKFYRDYDEHWAIYIETMAGDEKSVIHWWTNTETEEPWIRIDPFRTVKGNLCFKRKEINSIGIDMELQNLVVAKAIAFKNRVHDERQNYNGVFKDSKCFVDWCFSGLRQIDIETIETLMDPWGFVLDFMVSLQSTVDTNYHNDMVARNLRLGDVIRYYFQDYEHWALYIGDYRVMHWCKHDNEPLPRIDVGEYNTVARQCKAEIDWNEVDGIGILVVGRAREFRNRVIQFENLANLFGDSRQFAYWCHFGLRDEDVLNIPENENELNVFINDRMMISHPLIIIKKHNDMIQQQLRPGDLITFSRDSRKLFAVCVEVTIQGAASLIWWTEIDGLESCIMIDQFETLAEDRKAMIYTDRENLENAVEWDQMVQKAKALRTKVNNAIDDCTGLFSNSMHFAMWVFFKYGIEKHYDKRTNEDVWEHVYEFGKSSIIAADKVRIRQENKNVLNSFKEGDLVTFSRNLYTHYAVFTGRYEQSENCDQCRQTGSHLYASSCTHWMRNNTQLRSAVPGALSVIHWWTGPNAALKVSAPKACIRIDSFWTVASYDRADIGNDRKFEKRNIDGHKVAETAKRAQKEFEMEPGERKQTKKNYNLLLNNCEHFAYWCRYGKHISKQVSNLLFAVLLIGPFIITILLKRIIRIVEFFSRCKIP